MDEERAQASNLELERRCERYVYAILERARLPDNLAQWPEVGGRLERQFARVTASVMMGAESLRGPGRCFTAGFNYPRRLASADAEAERMPTMRPYARTGRRRDNGGPGVAPDLPLPHRADLAQSTLMLRRLALVHLPLATLYDSAALGELPPNLCLGCQPVGCWVPAHKSAPLGAIVSRFCNHSKSLFHGRLCLSATPSSCAAA